MGLYCPFVMAGLVLLGGAILITHMNNEMKKIQRGDIEITHYLSRSVGSNTFRVYLLHGSSGFRIVVIRWIGWGRQITKTVISGEEFKKALMSGPDKTETRGRTTVIWLGRHPDEPHDEFLHRVLRTWPVHEAFADEIREYLKDGS